MRWTHITTTCLLLGGLAQASTAAAEPARTHATAQDRGQEGGRQRGGERGQEGEARRRPGTPAQEQEQAGEAGVAGRLDSAVEQLSRKASARSASREDFQAVRQLLERQAQAARSEGKNAAPMLERAQRTLADLEQRSAAGEVAPGDVAMLQQEILDQRLDDALKLLRRKALARQATREDFQKARKLLERQAALASSDDSKGDAPRVAARRRLAALEEAALKGEAGAGQFEALDGELADLRLDRALAQLERRAAASGASRTDFQRAKEILEQRAARAKAVGGDAQAAEVYSKLQRALADLEQRAKDGDVKREDYAALREKLIARARAAASDED